MTQMPKWYIDSVRAYYKKQVWKAVAFVISTTAMIVSLSIFLIPKIGILSPMTAIIVAMFLPMVLNAVFVVNYRKLKHCGLSFQVSYILDHSDLYGRRSLQRTTIG